MVIYVGKFGYIGKQDGKRRFGYEFAEYKQDTKRGKNITLFSDIDFDEKNELLFGDIVECAVGYSGLDSKPSLTGIKLLQANPYKI